MKQIEISRALNLCSRYAIRSLLSIAVGFLTVTAPEDAFGQSDDFYTPADTASAYLIELSDGTEMIGKIIKRDSSRITFKTRSIPEISIPVRQIKSLKAIPEDRIKNGVYWFENFHASRYLFAPSAFGLNPGEAYYQNTYLLLNSVDVGVTDYFSMGGGFDFISVAATLTGQVNYPAFFLTPKVHFKLADKWHAGGGLLHFNIPTGNSYFMQPSRINAGIGYGILTYGVKDHNITAGAGRAYLIERGYSDEGVTLFTLSGVTRITRRTSLISENWMVADDGYFGVLFSYGARIFGEKLSVDIALLNSPEIIESVVIGVPYVSLAVRF